jgi:hypothetical protein
MFLQPYFQCYESLGRGWLRTRCPQAHKSSHWRSIYSSPLGGWMADPPTMIPAAQRRWEIFASRSTNASDGGIKPETSGSCSVSLAPSHIASQRERCAQDVSARASQSVFHRRRFVTKAQLQLGDFTRAQAQERNPLPTGKPDLTRGTLQI